MSKLPVKKMLQSMDKSEIISLVLEMYDTKREIKGLLSQPLYNTMEELLCR